MTPSYDDETLAAYFQPVHAETWEDPLVGPVLRRLAQVFASPEAIAHVVSQGKGSPTRAQKILDEAHGNPEAINERPEKNPAKRLKEVYPGYNKKNDGPRIAAKIGLERLREKCRHFNEWLSEIERRVGPRPSA